MKLTRTILVFLATYLAEFLITILLVSLVTTTTLEEALYSGTIKGINQDLSLSGNEIKILEILSSKPGEPFQRDYLINALGFNQERTLDVCINRLRKKIEKNPKVPKYLKTKRGSGYVLWID